MSEYLVRKDSLIAIANEVRELSGKTEQMTLNAMATNLGEANTEVDSQSALIAQIATALEGKAAGGEQATPEISVNSNGLITATAGVKSSTYQLAFQPAKTITPGTASQVAVSSGYYTGGDIVVAGDSNLIAGNIKNGVSIFGVNGTLEEGSMEGEKVEYSENEDAIINGTIVNYTNDRVAYIRPNAFSFCSSLVTINCPACIEIGGTIPNGVYSPNGAFNNCSNLTTVSFPACKIIGHGAFYKCSSLTTVPFPACTTIGNNAFYNCSNIISISFPVCMTIGSYAFVSCSRLTMASFPACSIIGSSAFYFCKGLTTASLPACTTIGNNAFQYCYNLSRVILEASSVCLLRSSLAFSSTPFTGYSSYFSSTPHIYVPSSLITAYQSATNWTYFSSYFSAIESLEK